MVRELTTKALATFLSLVLITCSPVYAFQSWSPTSNSSGENEPAPKSAAELQALVSPIALYPDALVAQVLSASTFPDQVVQAYQWQQQNLNLSGKALADAVNPAPWDPSVKAITQFPSVLEKMNKNLAWTSELGESYHFQPKDVMTAVQVLRAQAKAAGNLKSTSQMTVVEQSPDVIVIQPANPQVVYVPTYNPTVVYGTPYTVPNYSAGDAAAAAVIGFGAGIAIGSMMSSNYNWGWNAWGVGWHGGTVVYANNVYYGNAAWHGTYGAYGYNGYGTTYHGPNGSAASYHTAYGSGGAYQGTGPGGAYHTGAGYQNAYGGATQHTSYSPGGSVHTGGSGYSNVSGQGYHYGASSTAAGGSAYHGTTTSGEHYWGGTSASGQHYSGSGSGTWGQATGWSSRAASSRGRSSMGGGGFRR